MQLFDIKRDKYEHDMFSCPDRYFKRLGCLENKIIETNISNRKEFFEKYLTKLGQNETNKNLLTNFLQELEIMENTTINERKIQINK